ncbi:glycosyltransferase family 4 protein [Pseudarthrobacter sp. NIBRBAC000502771]|uniref:glycosyltransferase family 4 protein n=1 Tax=Pseudarthrobacter sp. NIBRBAC000502771 TaxID=2590774 RepID=UPI00143DFF5E|nr:glycosyltransferase family 4 protein [Pseudarthrobacter sp. NIBRBAC000502771]
MIATESLDAGGMDEVVAFLARGLHRRGYRVAVAHTPDYVYRRSAETGQDRLRHNLEAEGLEVVRLNAEDCEAWLRFWRPDVVSAHGVPKWMLESAAACSIPVVETLHGMHNQFNVDGVQVRARRDLLAGLVSVSEMVRRQYLAVDVDCEPDFITNIPNGVVSSPRPSISRENARRLLGLTDEYLFVSLARHCLQKNNFGLASAFSEVAEVVPNAHLLICGRPDDASYAEQVLELKNRMRHGGRLHLRDHTQQPRVLLSAADGFVLNSFFEGWALASMEALMSGVPVVMSDVGGAREQLADKPKWGCLVSNPLGDPLVVDWKSMAASRFQRQQNREELIAAMLSFSRDRAWSRSEGIAVEAARRFDADVCLSRHAKVLEAAAGTA